MCHDFYLLDFGSCREFVFCYLIRYELFSNIRLTIVTCTCIADEVYICDCSLTRTDDKQDDDVYYLTFLEAAIKDASRNNSENK